MFAGAETQRANLNRSPMKGATVTTSWNGWPNNRSATVKWQCGAVRTQASINGRPRKSYRRILPQSCPPLPLIRHSITPPTTTSAKLTTCNGLLSPPAAPDSKIFLPIKNFGAPNFSTPTKNTSRSKPSIRLSQIHQLTFNVFSNIRRLTRTTTRWCQLASNFKKSDYRF